MSDASRRKSPRAPSMGLEEAISRAFQAYDLERMHPAPTDIMAQHIGYKGANSGAALSAIASLRYFGLLHRPKDGVLAVSKELEEYKFTPDEDARHSILVGFLKNPPLYADLLKKYAGGLPSEANLRYDLIQRGFAPANVDTVLGAFLKSVQYVGYFSGRVESENDAKDQSRAEVEQSASADERAVNSISSSGAQKPLDLADFSINEFDRIPVRLTGGRRAWLIIPEPFFEADKERLKAQIDLILAEDA